MNMNAQSKKPIRQSWRLDKSYKVYPEGPIRSEYERICRDIQRTGRPEDIEELFFGEVNPEKGFSVLTEFEYDRKLRKDGSLAYCPCCDRSDHYYKGGLVWVHDAQAIAAVGRTCLGKEYADQVDRLKKNTRAEAQRDYLLEIIPKAHAWRAPIESLRPASHAAYEIQEAVKKRASGAFKHLRESTRGADKSLRLGDDVIGKLKGAIALNWNFHPTFNINDLTQRAGRYTQFTTDDQIIDFVADLENVALTRAVEDIRQFASKFDKIKNDLADFVAFFDESNVETIHKWANDPRNSCSFDIRIVKTRYARLLEIKSSRDDLSISLPPSLFVPNVFWPEN